MGGEKRTKSYKALLVLGFHSSVDHSNSTRRSSREKRYDVGSGNLCLCKARVLFVTSTHSVIIVRTSQIHTNFILALCDLLDGFARVRHRSRGLSFYKEFFFFIGSLHLSRFLFSFPNKGEHGKNISLR